MGHGAVKLLVLAVLAGLATTADIQAERRFLPAPGEREGVAAVPPATGGSGGAAPRRLLAAPSLQQQQAAGLAATGHQLQQSAQGGGGGGTRCPPLSRDLFSRRARNNTVMLAVVRRGFGGRCV